jgi:bifunctional non-homologous end joining protein LigD
MFADVPDAAQFAIKRHRTPTWLHYDIRFEAGEVVYSFASGLGISRDPNVLREANFVDTTHGVSGFDFEGVFSKGSGGSGTMLRWDFGGYVHTTNLNNKPLSFEEAFQKGRIEFELSGDRLKGGFVLERRKGKVWDIRKLPDEHAVIGCDIAQTEITSIDTGRTLEQIEEEDRQNKLWRQARRRNIQLELFTS